MTSGKRRRGRPNATQISVESREQISAMCGRFGLPDTVLTYRDLARELSRKLVFRVALGTVHDLAHGREPKGTAIRLALGLPALQAVAICPTHGVVHLKRCPGRNKEQDYDTWRAENINLIEAILLEV